MKLIKLYTVIGMLVLFSSCSSEKTLDERIIEKAKADVVSKLKSPDTYKSYGFRIVTLHGPMNEGKYYSGALKDAYMQKEYETFQGDTIWAGRFFVYHTFQSSNSLGAIIKETVELNYDGHLNLLNIGKWDEQEDLRLERLLKKNNQILEPIK